jgi:hypothetical protein
VLNGTSGLPSGTSGIDGSFNTANPAGWCVDKKCTGNYLPADGDNQQTGPWRESNDHVFVGIDYHEVDKKFAIANGAFTSTLETPVFSLIGQTQASLDFFQAYIINAGSSAKIEISTNGGATYTNVLAQYSGSLGISGANANMQPASISLSNYIGLSNLRIKFTYTGADINSAWVIDGIGFPGTQTPVVTTWTAPDGTVINGTPATVSPTTTTTYTVTTRIGDCVVGSTQVTVYVNTLTPGTIAGGQTICSNGDPSAFTVSAAATGQGTLSYQWQSNTTGCAGTWTDISGAIGTAYDPPSGLTQTTYYRRVVRSTLNGVACTDNSNCITVTVNSVTPGTIAGDQNVCTGGDPAAFTEATASSGTGTVSYQWQSSTTGCSGTWTNILSATGATYDVPAGLNTTTSYRRVVTYTLNGVQCSAFSNCVTVTVKAFPVVTPVNSCIGGGTVTFTQTGGDAGGTWSVSGGGTIDASSGVFTPSTAGCFTVTYKTPGTECADTKSFVVFPAAPPAPVVPGCGAISITPPPSVPGFNIQYSFDDGANWDKPIPTADNCDGYKIRARYVTANDCGSTVAGTVGIGACAISPATTRKVDNTKPVLTCPDAQAFCIVANNTYTIPSLVASDNCSANSALTITYSITGATIRNGTGLDASGSFNLGVSTITWTVTDECGNSNTCTTQVTINPRPAPTIYHN